MPYKGSNLKGSWGPSTSNSKAQARTRVTTPLHNFAKNKPGVQVGEIDLKKDGTQRKKRVLISKEQVKFNSRANTGLQVNTRSFQRHQTIP